MLLEKLRLPAHSKAYVSVLLAIVGGYSWAIDHSGPEAFVSPPSGP
jgi:hypothetical protein